MSEDNGLDTKIDMAFRISIMSETPCTLTWKECESILDTIANLKIHITDMEELMATDRNRKLWIRRNVNPYDLSTRGKS